MENHAPTFRTAAICLLAGFWLLYAGCSNPEIEQGYVELSLQKIRTEIPPEEAILDVSVDSMGHWSGTRVMPHPGLHREKWGPEDRAYVYMQEWKAVRMSGYLQQAHNEPDGDLHMYICDSAYGDLSRSVVSEMTSRFRQTHPWQLYNVEKYFHQQVRITGWLMWDEEHDKGSDRASVWEIHPVTKFEVFENGDWRELK